MCSSISSSPGQLESSGLQFADVAVLQIHLSTKTAANRRSVSWSAIYRASGFHSGGIRSVVGALTGMGQGSPNGEFLVQFPIKINFILDSTAPMDSFL